MNARYYDPANGRFISQDTYRGELDDADQWHLYAYCANNPINYVDPSGHWSIRRSTAALFIDAFLTIYMPWWKWTYDVIGEGIEVAFMKVGKKRASEILLGAIPKFQRAYSKCYYQIRKTIRWGLGYTIRIGASPVIAGLIRKAARYIRKGSWYDALDIVLDLTSFGGAVSVGLDWYSDNRLNGWIKMW